MTAGTGMAAALLLAMSGSGVAHAGGMFLPLHGVHDTERAGALIAGSEDADSLWLNPAGLAHLAGTGGILVDGAFVKQAVDYTRIDSGGNLDPTTSNTYPGITVPTIAAAFPLGDKVVIAAGVTAPYAGIGRYDDANAAATRYTNTSLAESLFVYLTAGIAAEPVKGLRIGATVTSTVTILKSQVSLSACPGQTICAPEDPDFDARTNINAKDLFAPSVGVGIQYDIVKQVTLGAAANTATYIDASGTVATQLPSSAFFQGASVVGNAIDAKLDLPATTKFGIEVRPVPQLRVELALDVEYWGVQKGIGLTTHGVEITNQAGVGTYELSPVAIPREYKTSYAPALGGEYRFGKASVGAGYSYETRAAPPAYVSALTVDSGKHIIGFGGDYRLGKWTVGAALAYVKLTDTAVSLETAKVNQLSPLRDQPSETFVNAGYYKSSYVVAGLRVSRPL